MNTANPYSEVLKFFFWFNITGNLHSFDTSISLWEVSDINHQKSEIIEYQTVYSNDFFVYRALFYNSKFSLIFINW